MRVDLFSSKNITIVEWICVVGILGIYLSEIFYLFSGKSMFFLFIIAIFALNLI